MIPALAPTLSRPSTCASTAPQVSEDDLTRALTSACICCILAKAGPQRSRILANLYKDERTRSLPIFPFLQKVYLERILRQDEVRPHFTAVAEPHQLLELVM